MLHMGPLEVVDFLSGEIIRDETERDGLAVTAYWEQRFVIACPHEEGLQTFLAICVVAGDGDDLMEREALVAHHATVDFRLLKVVIMCVHRRGGDVDETALREWRCSSGYADILVRDPDTSGNQDCKVTTNRGIVKCRVWTK